MIKDLQPIARALKRNMSSAVWESVPDPRNARGRRHTLSSVLKQLTLGLLTHQRTLRDVERLGTRAPAMRELGVRSAPSDSTMDRILRTISPEGLRPLVHEQVKAMRRNKQLERAIDFPYDLVAVDGKAVGTDKVQLHPESHRVTTKGQAPRFVLKSIRAVHVSSAVRPVLDQKLQPAQRGERVGLEAFLLGLRATYGSLVQCLSFDAGFWSLHLAIWLSSLFIPYIFALKGNAGSAFTFAHKELGDETREPPTGWEAEVIERVGSRIVRRQIARVKTDLGTCGAIAQAWRQRTRVEVKGELVSEDNRYFVTNIPLTALTPQQALAAVRAHWGIENDSNWTMDVILDEDSSAWVRQATAREALTWLRIFAYNILRLLRMRTRRGERESLLPWREVLDEVTDTVLGRRVETTGFS